MSHFETYRAGVDSPSSSPRSSAIALYASVIGAQAALCQGHTTKESSDHRNVLVAGDRLFGPDYQRCSSDKSVGVDE